MRLLLVTILLLSGCASPAPQGASTPTPTEASPTELTGEWVLLPRGSQELNFEMDAGGAMTYDINASATIAWNLHSHPGGSLKEWKTGKERRANGTFTAPTADVYSILVEGTGSTAKVTVRVVGDVRAWRG